MFDSRYFSLIHCDRTAMFNDKTQLKSIIIEKVMNFYQFIFCQVTLTNLAM